MDSSRKEELLDKYLWDEISEEEMVLFMKEVEKDPDLKSQIQMDRVLQKMGKMKELNSCTLSNKAKVHLEKSYLEGFAPKKPKSRRIIIRVFVAANLIAILGMIFYYFSSNGELTNYSSNQSIFKVKSSQATSVSIAKEYLIHTPDFLTSRSNNQHEELLNYERRYYQQAIIDIKSYLNANPSDNEIRYYLGRSYLHIGDAENAIKTFSLLKNLKGFQFSEGVVFSLALANLLENQPILAKSELETLVNSDYYGTEAKAILSKLNKLTPVSE